MLLFPQVVKQYSTFCGTQRFITVFTSARRFVPVLDQISPVHGVSLLSPILRLGPSRGFPTKCLYAFLLAIVCLHQRHFGTNAWKVVFMGLDVS